MTKSTGLTVEGGRAAAIRPSFDVFSLRSLGFLLALVLAVFIFYPFGLIIVRTFFGAVGPTQAGLFQALREADTLHVLWNTLFFVGLSGAIAMVAGVAFAWLNQRTDAGSGWIGELFPVMPLLVPQIAGVTGWVMLLAPGAGLLNNLLRHALAWFGVDVQAGPLNIYTPYGFVAILALYLVPYVYLPVSAAFQSLDPALDEASRMCRAGAFTTFRRVTLPVIKPALIAAALLVLMMGFAIFSVPIVIGTGAHIEVLSVQIYHLIFAYPSRLDLAILLGLFLTLVVQGLLLMQALVGNVARSATIGGKGQRVAPVKLGRWRPLARGIVVLYILGSTVIPVIGLVLVSLQPFWTANVNWSLLGFQNYVTVFVGNQTTRTALLNSIILGIAGASAGMLMAAILVTAAGKSKSLASRVIQLVTAVPAGIPHIALGVGFIFAFSSGWFAIRGTLLILFLAYLVIHIPQAMRTATLAIDQVGPELLEASQLCKAPPRRTFLRILLPLMRPGILAGWVILFVQMSGELTASALLAGSNNPVIGQVIIDFWQNGSFPEIAALAVIMTVVNTVVVSVVLRFSGRPSLS